MAAMCCVPPRTGCEGGRQAGKHGRAGGGIICTTKTIIIVIGDGIGDGMEAGCEHG